VVDKPKSRTTLAGRLLLAHVFGLIVMLLVSPYARPITLGGSFFMFLIAVALSLPFIGVALISILAWPQWVHSHAMVWSLFGIAVVVGIVALIAPLLMTQAVAISAMTSGVAFAAISRVRPFRT
jgi:hypothetical protein